MKEAMDGRVRTAAALLRSALGNVDLLHMPSMEFKRRLLAYATTLSGNFEVCKTKIHALTEAWEIITDFKENEAVDYFSSDDSSSDDEIRGTREGFNWITSAMSSVADKRALADMTAEQLIEEEERQKKKQEKRREKKKRRNERKKQQNNHAGESLKGAASTIGISQDNASCSDAVEANKTKSKVDETDKEMTRKEGGSDNTEDKWHVVVKGNRLVEMTESKTKSMDAPTAQGYTYGRQGNFRAEMGQFDEAIKCYTNAIQHLSKDSKLYGNRSCCYEKLEKYDKALEDANKAIELDPALHMNYFRKGLALSGLKRYRDAEKAFKQVMRLDPQCCFPIRELMLLRKTELMDMGFNEKQAYAAACKYKTVQEASNAILENKIPDDPMDDVYMSEEDDPDYIGFSLEELSPSIKEAPTAPPVTIYNSRPSDCTVWVGNILTTIDNVELQLLFSKYGEVKSVTVLRDKVKDDCHCAFIDFREPTSVQKAIVALNGFNLNGKNLILRVPNKPVVTVDSETAAKAKEDALNRLKTKTLSLNGECYYWRTIGNCRNGTKCNYKHVLEHRLIDRK